MQNYTAVDLVGTAAATLALAFFLLPPGYLLALATNFLGFRRRGGAEQLLFSVVYSTAAAPVLAVLAVRYGGYRLALALFLLMALAACFFVLRRLPRPLCCRLDRTTAVLLVVAAAWLGVVALSTADIQVGDRLYLSVLTYDHSIRVPLVGAAARLVPPVNPFYGVGQPPLLRYFYYWYVVCALPMRLFGLTARHSLNGSICWSGFALAALLPLYLKHFCGITEKLRRKSLLAVGLLAVTGLDLIPCALIMLRERIFIPDTEWWDSSQVASWLGSLLWVPHHVAALTACMAGLLPLASVDEETRPAQRVTAAMAAALCFASAAGLSLYVAFSFAVAAVVWGGFLLAQRQFRSFTAWVGASGIAVLLSLPYLTDLIFGRRDPAVALAGAAASESAGRFAHLAVRGFLWIEIACRMRGVEQPVLLALADLAVLPLVYFLEFGFFALVAWLTWRRQREGTQAMGLRSRLLWVMFVVPLLAMSFLSSDTTGFNDLGFRGMLVVQFVLLLWAVPVAGELYGLCRNALGRWTRRALRVALLLGLAATAWQLIALRVYEPLAAAGVVDRAETLFGSGGYPERALSQRRAGEAVAQTAPADALVQYNPVREEARITQLYSSRQAVAGDANCNAAFGGDYAACRAVFPQIAAIFNDRAAMRSREVDAVCDKFRISYLLATDADPVWGDGKGWVWRRSTLFAGSHSRLLPCGR